MCHMPSSMTKGPLCMSSCTQCDVPFPFTFSILSLCHLHPTMSRPRCPVTGCERLACRTSPMWLTGNACTMCGQSFCNLHHQDPRTHWCPFMDSLESMQTRMPFVLDEVGDGIRTGILADDRTDVSTTWWIPKNFVVSHVSFARGIPACSKKDQMVGRSVREGPTSTSHSCSTMGCSGSLGSEKSSATLRQRLLCGSTRTVKRRLCMPCAVLA